jgi:hypothetical protein
LCAVVCAVVAAGCSNEDVTVPAACEEGPETLMTALQAAPGQVRLPGGVALADCFQQAAPPASVQNLGSALLATTQQLSDRVRRDPHSDAAVQLGYLVGVVRHGEGVSTGLYYEVTRRVEQELRGLDLHTPEFSRGLEAGKRDG